MSRILIRLSFLVHLPMPPGAPSLPLSRHLLTSSSIEDEQPYSYPLHRLQCAIMAQGALLCTSDLLPYSRIAIHSLTKLTILIYPRPRTCTPGPMPYSHIASIDSLLVRAGLQAFQASKAEREALGPRADADEARDRAVGGFFDAEICEGVFACRNAG